jgi:ATP-dependent helicase IRC3
VTNSIPFRPYQNKQEQDLDSGIKRGLNRMIVAAATGAGKTVFAGGVTNKYNMPTTIMQVHRDELARQSVSKLRDMNPGKTIGVVKAERDELDADILVVSAQTLAQSKRLNRLNDAIKDRRPLLMWSDECHHDAARSRSRTIETLDPELLVGLTATAFRSDRQKLSNIYQEIVSYTSPLELMEQGWLVWPVGKRVDIDVDVGKVKTIAGDLSDGDLALVMDTPRINREIVDSWFSEVDAVGRKHTLVFCVNVDHAKHITEEFKRRGVNAAYIVGTTPTEEREEIYESFRSGDLKVLVGVYVFTEGWDEPCVDTILMCRPTKSLLLYIQVVGRGLRPSPGKEDLLVIDYVGNSGRHRLITFPTWAGAEVLGEESIDNPATTITESTRRSGQSVKFSDIVSKIRGAKTKKVSSFDVLNGSPFLWNIVDGDWVINAGSNEYITVIKKEDGYVPFRIYQESVDGARGTRKVWQAKALFPRSLAMDMAIGLAETSIKENPLTSRDAGWRLKAEPPTEAQIKYANILGIDVPFGATKSTLSDLIDRATFTRAKKAVQLG